MFYPARTFAFLVALAAIISLPQALAEEVQQSKGYELTPYIGYTFGSDINDLSGNDISLTDDMNIGLAFSWQDSPNGQGQVLVNYVGHDFDNPTSGESESLNVLYTHFSGVALFRQQSYITTVSFGLGGAYMDSDNESGIYPSATAAFGTRYEFNPSFAVFTELRAYATVTDDDDEFFCKNDGCYAEFGEAIYVDTSISVGLAFTF